MPHKSRRRGKHIYGKKARGRPALATPAAPVSPARGAEPPPRAEGVAAPARAPALRATVLPKLNVTTEMKRVGIIAGVILAVLIVLSLAL